MDDIFLVILLVALIYSIYSFVKSKNKKNGIISAVIAVVAFVAFGITTDSTEEEASENTEASEEKPVEEVIKEEKPEEPKEEIEEEPKEEAVKEKETEEEQEPVYEVIDDIMVFTEEPGSYWSEESHVDSFSSEMTNLLKENHDKSTNGIIFRSVQNLVDKLGNEEPYNVIVAYYSQETVEAINYNNWPMLDAEGLYTTADALWVHSAFQVNAASNNISAPEDTPELYYNYISQSIVE